jgi:drug/metabolite transporter (DMT)-like permease
VQAVLGGSGAALAWAVASLCASRCTRALGVAGALAWVMLTGMLVVAPMVALAPAPSLHGEGMLWLVGAAAGTVGGLRLTYMAFAVGEVGVVSPIVSAEGGVTVALAVIGGARLGAGRTAAFAAVLAGAVLVARGSDDGPAGSGSRATAAALAAASALSFGFGLYATARAGAHMSAAWAVAPSRLLGLAVLTLPVAVRRGLPPPGPLLGFVLLGGTCEVLGFLSYTAGARAGIALTAVFASLTGALAAGLGRLMLAERLARAQLAGVALLVTGVAALSAGV